MTGATHLRLFSRTTMIPIPTRRQRVGIIVVW